MKALVGAFNQLGRLQLYWRARRNSERMLCCVRSRGGRDMLQIRHNDFSIDEIPSEMETPLSAAELMCSSVNKVTVDGGRQYSRGDFIRSSYFRCFLRSSQASWGGPTWTGGGTRIWIWDAMTRGKFPFNKNLNIGSGDRAQTRGWGEDGQTIGLTVASLCFFEIH